MDINNENNFIKYEGKTDLTEVAHKAYSDGGQDIIKELGIAGSNVMKFFNNTVGGVLSIYNAWAEPKIEQIKENIKNKMLKIPKQNLVPPPYNILGYTLEGLKYNLNEDKLKEMFENLIVNSCNSAYSDKIHPRYAEIIKQLSRNDAIFLKELSRSPNSAYPIVNIIRKSEKGFITLFPNFYLSNTLDIKDIPAIINNLQTLGILEINYEKFLTNESVYENVKNSEYYKNLEKKYSQISYQKGIFVLTTFGRNFVEICV